MLCTIIDVSIDDVVITLTMVAFKNKMKQENNSVNNCILRCQGKRQREIDTSPCMATTFEFFYFLCKLVIK